MSRTARTAAERLLAARAPREFDKEVVQPLADLTGSMRRTSAWLRTTGSPG